MLWLIVGLNPSHQCGNIPLSVEGNNKSEDIFKNNHAHYTE